MAFHILNVTKVSGLFNDNVNTEHYKVSNHRVTDELQGFGRKRLRNNCDTIPEFGWTDQCSGNKKTDEKRNNLKHTEFWRVTYCSLAC